MVGRVVVTGGGEEKSTSYFHCQKQNASASVPSSAKLNQNPFLFVVSKVQRALDLNPED